MKIIALAQITRFFPVIAVCAATLPLVGCGGGGATGAMSPLPPVAPTPQPPVQLPTPMPLLPVPEAPVTPSPEAETPAPDAKPDAPAIKPDAPVEKPAPVPIPTPVAPAPVQPNEPVTNNEPVRFITERNPIAVATEAAVNEQRIAQGLAPLANQATLAQIAQAYAEQMANGGFYSHTDPQSKTVFDRAQAAGYAYTALGENLARIKVKAGNETTFAVNGWMSSPTHRVNIVSPQYTETAIGMAKTADGTIYMVQVFGRRK